MLASLQGIKHLPHVLLVLKLERWATVTSNPRERHEGSWEVGKSTLPVL